ncbi:MAG: SusC/RagA family TonB-linked outer membrane protein, partial [Mangrovibacterium sp.]
MKKCLEPREICVSWLKKLWFMMRLCTLLILLAVTSVSASVYSQNAKLTLKMKSTRIADVFNSIEEQTNYYFFYNRELFDDSQLVDVDMENKSVREILDMLFEGRNVDYKIVDRNILIEVDAEQAYQLSQQAGEVRGKVTDSSGVPLPGATVVVKGTTNGTITDFDGNYVIGNVDAGTILVFSFVGMKAQEVELAGRSVVNIRLLEDAIGIEEVVAIGYGTMKKSDLTGSVGSIKSDKLVSRGSTSVMEGLQGQVAGVNIQQASSRSGDGFNIQIRGKSSMQGGEPLYVIDGVVCDNMNFLNPMDIEKIDVLKDASSTAIYGSRATNGVLMITTKKGTEGTTATVSYDGYYGIKKSAYMPDFMDGDEFLRYRFSRYLSSSMDASSGATEWNMTEANFRNFWNADSPVVKQIYADKNYTDWHDIVLQDGQQQNHFVNISGNNKNINYRVGVGYQSEDDILYTEYERWNLKTALDSKISDQLSVGFNANFATSIQRRGSSNSVQTGFKMTPV